MAYSRLAFAVLPCSLRLRPSSTHRNPIFGTRVRSLNNAFLCVSNRFHTYGVKASLSDNIMSETSNQVPSSVPRHVHRSTHNGYEVRTTPNRGEGLFATRPFVRGQIVVEGVIVAELSANHSHATQVALDRFVQHGGHNSLVNHSCDPNCGIKLNASGGNDIVVMRDIAIGEEICFDYAMRNYSIQHFPKECACGAAHCRKTITGYKDLPYSFKTRYEGFIAPYLVEMETPQVTL